jgi:hypothetical protein
LKDWKISYCGLIIAGLLLEDWKIERLEDLLLWVSYYGFVIRGLKDLILQGCYLKIEGLSN